MAAVYSVSLDRLSLSRGRGPVGPVTDHSRSDGGVNEKRRRQKAILPVHAKVASGP